MAALLICAETDVNFVWVLDRVASDFMVRFGGVVAAVELALDNEASGNEAKLDFTPIFMRLNDVEVRATSTKVSCARLGNASVQIS
jgi:hypothetical protein